MNKTFDIPNLNTPFCADKNLLIKNNSIKGVEQVPLHYLGQRYLTY